MEAVNFDIMPKVHTIFFLFNCFEVMQFQDDMKKKIKNGKTEECLLVEKCFWTALQS